MRKQKQKKQNSNRDNDAARGANDDASGLRALLELPKSCAILDKALLMYTAVHMLLQNLNVYRTNYFNYNARLILHSVLTLAFPLVKSWGDGAPRDSAQPLSGAQVAQAMLAEGQPQPDGGGDSGDGGGGGDGGDGGTTQQRTVLFALYHLCQAVLLGRLYMDHRPAVFLPLLLPYALRPLLFGTLHGETSAQLVARKGTACMWSLYRLALFRALECAFYAGVLPLLFIEHHFLYFDKGQCFLLVMYVLVNVHCLLLVQAFAAHYCELSADLRARGAWRLVASPLQELKPSELDAAETWSSKLSYSHGHLVTYSGCYYRAEGRGANTARPGVLSSRVFHFILSQPQRTYFALAVAQGLLITTQLFMLLKHQSLRWWTTHSVMLLASCFVFWLCSCMRLQHRDALERAANAH
jgi:hypothetical protein